MLSIPLDRKVGNQVVGFLGAVPGGRLRLNLLETLKKAGNGAVGHVRHLAAPDVNVDVVLLADVGRGIPVRKAEHGQAGKHDIDAHAQRREIGVGQAHRTGRIQQKHRKANEGRILEDRGVAACHLHGSRQGKHVGGKNRRSLEKHEEVVDISREQAYGQTDDQAPHAALAKQPDRQNETGDEGQVEADIAKPHLKEHRAVGKLDEEKPNRHGKEHHGGADLRGNAGKPATSLRGKEHASHKDLHRKGDKPSRDARRRADAAKGRKHRPGKQKAFENDCAHHRAGRRAFRCDGKAIERPDETDDAKKIDEGTKEHMSPYCTVRYR